MTFKMSHIKKQQNLNNNNNKILKMKQKKID